MTKIMALHAKCSGWIFFKGGVHAQKIFRNSDNCLVRFDRERGMGGTIVSD